MTEFILGAVIGATLAVYPMRVGWRYLLAVWQDRLAAWLQNLRQSAPGFAVLCMTILAASAASAQAHPSASFTWTASGSNPSNIYRAPCGAISSGACVSEGTYVKLNTTPLTTSSYVDTAVSGSGKYVYYVTAFCAACTPSESNPSNKIAVTIPADPLPQPPPPTGLTNVQVALNNSGRKIVADASWKNAPRQRTTFAFLGRYGALLKSGRTNSRTTAYAVSATMNTRPYYLKLCADGQACVVKSL